MCHDARVLVLRSRPGGFRRLVCAAVRVVRRCLASFTLWLVPIAVAGQGASPIFTRIDQRAGLPHNTVHTLLQDHRGFLWVGTADGLARYDGRAFRVYRRRPGEPGSLPSNTVQALAEDADGTLWVGTAAGACRLVNEAAGRFECLESGPSDLLHLASSGGVVWLQEVGASYYWEEGDLHNGPFDDVGRIWNVRANAEGDVLGFRVDTLAGRLVHAQLGRVEPGSRRFVPTARLAIRPGEQTVAWLEGGRVRTVRVPGGAGVTVEVPGRGREGRVALGVGGTRWMGLSQGLHRKTAGGRIEPVQVGRDGNVLSNTVSTLLVTRDGTLWVGTLGGLFVHDPAPRPFSHRPVVGGGPVMAIHVDARGAVWSGTLAGGVEIRRADGEICRITRADGLVSDDVWGLAAAPGDPEAVWVAAEGGVCMVRAGRVERCVTAPLARTDGRTFAYTFADDGEGGLWAGGSAIVRLDAETGRVRQRVDLDHHSDFSTLTALHQDRTGRLWVGVEKRGLWYLGETGELFRLRSSLLDVVAVWSIHEDESGALWLGTSDGLFRLSPNRRRLTVHARGLEGAVVYGVTGRGDRLWLSTSHGLASYDMRSGRLRTFGPADGVVEQEFNRRALGWSPQGTLAIGGVDGVTTLDPAALRRPRPGPPPVVTSIEATTREAVRRLDPSPDLRLGPSTRAVRVTFPAPLLTRAAGGRYGARLTGSDVGWSTLDVPEVRYVGLSPGRYVLHTRAAVADGPWTEGEPLAFVLAPPWYATWWFRLLLAGLGVGALVEAYRLRVRAIRRQERLRWRIASDLHDDIGSGLASVALLAERVRDQGTIGEPERRQLTAAAAAARRMVESLREIVWFVDPAHDRPGAFVEKLRALAFDLAGPSATVEVSGRTWIDAAPLGLRRSVLLAVKEALHNATRHGQPTSVHLRLRSTSGTLRIEVDDDGAGFDVATTPPGTGLRSLRRRAAEWGGGVSVESEPGRGTRVSFDVPRPRG